MITWALCTQSTRSEAQAAPLSHRTRTTRRSVRRSTAYTDSTDEYSLSSPGSMSTAWAMMRMALEPISQKNSESGLAIMRSGMPTTKSAIYSVFWVMTWLPTVTGSGPECEHGCREYAGAWRRGYRSVKDVSTGKGGRAVWETSMDVRLVCRVCLAEGLAFDCMQHSYAQRTSKSIPAALFASLPVYRPSF